VASLKQKEKQNSNQQNVPPKIIKCGEQPFSFMMEVEIEHRKLIAHRD